MEKDQNYDEEVNSPMSSLDSYGILRRTPSELSASITFSPTATADLFHNTTSHQSSSCSDVEMFKARFSKLLLGEDMSGCGKGVATSLAIANSITNLFANIFGEFMVRLESLPYEKKLMWNQEMDCLLSVCNYIFEPNPITAHSDEHQKSSLVHMRLRSDISDNLPALKKLDNMLQVIMDGFQATDFWYIEKQKLPSSNGTMGSFRWATNPRDIEKWWLPLPCVPPNGLSENSRQNLITTRKCADQIHKASSTINSTVLSEMDVPEIYMSSLPKNARKYLGDAVYRHMSTKEQFFPENPLNSLDLKSSDHKALDVADLLEASMHIWRRKACIRNSKASWNDIKDVNSKNTILANRAETTLQYLKHLYPQLSQTTLDISKIQYNKDIGQAILESYSRVLECLAFNVTARIDDVLYIDGLAKNTH